MGLGSRDARGGEELKMGGKHRVNGKSKARKPRAYLPSLDMIREGRKREREEEEDMGDKSEQAVSRVRIQRRGVKSTDHLSH